MWEIARRPRWIGVLFVCLGIAAIFAALGQWQLGRAVDEGTVIERETEASVPLDSIATPQETVTTIAAGQRVEFTGSAVEGDYVVIGERLNGGVAGYWVVGHVIVEDAPGASLAVALGWAPDRDAAARAIADLPPLSGEFEGRYLATEPPQEDDFEAGEQQSVGVAALINQWAEAPSSVYGGYVVLDEAPAGLDAIDSPEPVTNVELNWLNIFYAIEWAVFAGFAVFLWFRLVKDEWEREHDPGEPELN
jgi:cytochrome oxidase assembly protein ShyY1